MMYYVNVTYYDSPREDCSGFYSDTYEFEDRTECMEEYCNLCLIYRNEPVSIDTNCFSEKDVLAMCLDVIERKNKRIDEFEKLSKAKEQRFAKAKNLIRNLLYAYQLGKNELATARIMAEAEQFLKEAEE